MADKKKLPKMSELEVKPHHFPSTITLDENDYKDIAEWKVGKKYKLEIVVKQISASQDEMSPMGDTDSDKLHAKFVVEEVLEGEEYEGKEKKEDDKEEKETEEDDKEEVKKPAVTEAISRKFKK